MKRIAQPLNWSELDNLAVNTIRTLSMDMVQKANSGHPGMPMGFALAAHLLWTRFMHFNPDNPYWPGRDRFVLSCGHGSALIYSLLHLAGYDLTMEELKQFRQWGSKTPGHPEYMETPGVETTTGPLGQGIANAIGMAMAQRYVREQLGTATSGFDPLDHHIYAVVSDGDLQEGVSGEASSLAGRQKLDRLVVLYDDNRISIDGSTEKAWVEDVPARYAAYGWHVQRVNGTDPAELYNAILQAQSEKEQPSFIAVKTHIGYGSPNKQDSAKAHGAPLGEEEIRLTKAALGWPHSDPFFVPDEVYALYSESADRGRNLHEDWLNELDTWRSSNPDSAALYTELVHGVERTIDLSALPTFDAGKAVATRNVSGEVTNALAKDHRALIGGSADLAGSVMTMLAGESDFLPEQPGGRNIYFGVREHAMGAIANGMALYGLRPYTGTFLQFADYMRAPIRLAALMHLPVVFVFSHDSIGLGEDGPTHQPVEHIAALRTIPNLQVWRPGDANETVVAWKMAMEHRTGPSAILTTRQKVATIDRNRYAPAAQAERGGYVLADCDGNPDLILLATGSEVPLALEAWEVLQEEGVKVRLVSLPCWEVFELQNEEYRASVLPAGVTKRISIEMGVGFGWDRYVGRTGRSVSLERFGASAPAEVLFQEFGFTVESIVQTAKQFMGE